MVTIFSTPQTKKWCWGIPALVSKLSWWTNIRIPNVAQYMWLRLLCIRPQWNICPARGLTTSPESIGEARVPKWVTFYGFEKDFPGRHVVRLSRIILQPAYSSRSRRRIAENEGRLGKTLWTESREGDKVRLDRALDGEGRGALDRCENRSVLPARKPKRWTLYVGVKWQFSCGPRPDARFLRPRFLTHWTAIPRELAAHGGVYERLEIRERNGLFRW